MGGMTIDILQAPNAMVRSTADRILWATYSSENILFS
jgi:hypothetical protein